MKVKNVSKSDLKKLIEQLNIDTELLMQEKMAIILEDIIEEHELLKFLKVTSKTMYNYRKEGHFDYIKIKGKVYYFKSIFLAQLLTLQQV